MRPAPFIALAAFPALLAGCAGGMTTAECAGADWSALGFEDGRAGAAAEIFDKRREDCAGAGPVDADAYELARIAGLKTYCTAEGGFAAGRKGDEYDDVCPAEAENVFVASFAQGRKLFELTAEKDGAVTVYEAAIADLDQHRYLLKVSEKRALKPSITNEDREMERQDAAWRKREIARLENKIPQMLKAIETAGAALDAYRDELKSAGLEP